MRHLGQLILPKIFTIIGNLFDMEVFRLEYLCNTWNEI